MPTEVNAWWSGDPAERFWMVNERLGDHEEDEEWYIISQQYDKDGKESTFTRLCDTMKEGDILFHYWPHKRAIMYWSHITSTSYDAELDPKYTTIDTDDETVPAVAIDYRRMPDLKRPINLDQLRGAESELMNLRDTLVARHGTIYFPWYFYGVQNRLRPAQDYLSKLPAAAFSILERLGNFEVSGADSVLEQVDEPEESPEEAQSDEAERVIVHTPTSDSAKRISESERRTAVEQHAVHQAQQYFAERGYAVVSREADMPYDLEATLDAETLHIEVKGSSTPVDHVSLTAGEVQHDAGDAERVLFVVDDIALDITSDGLIETNGGRERVWWPWNMRSDDSRLTPLTYRYTLPPRVANGDSSDH